MTSHTSYPVNGIVQFRCTPIVDVRMLRADLGSIGGYEGWYLYMMCLREAGSKVSVFIPHPSFIDGETRNPKFRVRSFLKFVNQNDTMSASVETRKTLGNILRGPTILESEVLDEKNGWSTDGWITVALGVQVEAIRIRKMWKFKFQNPLFNYEESSDMITFMHDNDEQQFLFCHKKLLMHHSPRFLKTRLKKKADSKDSEVIVHDKISLSSMECCLQIAHGVRLKLRSEEISGIMAIARHYRLRNVISYCEQKLMRRSAMITDSRQIKKSIEFNLRHHFSFLMKEIDSKEVLKFALQDMDIQKMKGEMMKQCAKVFFDLSLN